MRKIFIFLITTILLILFNLPSNATSNYTFDRSWSSILDSSSKENITSIEFLYEIPVGYVDTSKTINGIKLYKFENDSNKIAFICQENIKVDCKYLFANCKELETINFKNFDTSESTSMQNMFLNCENLTNLDLSTFNTNEVNRLDCMFQGCQKLSYIDLSSFDTSKVIIMNQMFCECKSLTDSFGINGTSIKIGDSFKTTNVNNISSMFAQSGITKVDMSMFDLSNLTTNGTSGLFRDCTLYRIDLSKKLASGVSIEIPGKYFDKEKKENIGSATTNIIFNNEFINNHSLETISLVKHEICTYPTDDCICETCGYDNHNYGTWIPEDPAYCGHYGTKGHYNCPRCNKNFDENHQEILDLVIIPTIHIFSEEWYKDENKHWHECACKNKSDEANHDYEDWKTIKDATKDETGLKKRICKTCGYEEEQITYHEHIFEGDWYYDDDSHYHKCSCGEIGTKENHSYSDWQIISEATEEKEGLKRRTCICGKIEEESITKLPHTHKYSNDWYKDENKHWHECACKNKSDEANHDYEDWKTIKDATKDETGLKKRICKTCGYEEEQITYHEHIFEGDWYYDDDSHYHKCSCGEIGTKENHSYSDWQIISEATEEKEGLKRRTCICGKIEEESITKLPHTHKYSNDWYKDENKHWHECECGDKSDEANHDYGNWQIIKSPTTKEEGLEERTCIICGEKQTRDISRLNDNTSLILIIVIPSFIGLLVIIYIIMYIIWVKNKRCLKILKKNFELFDKIFFKK